MSDVLTERLRAGAQALALELSDVQLAQLLEFLALLQKWNKVYNLTAVRDPQEMLTHHLLDSLAAVTPLRRHIAQAGLAATPARRGVCHLLPWGGRELRGHCGQEGGLHSAGCCRAAPSQFAWHPCAGREPGGAV